MDMIDRQAAIAELNAKYHGMISDESMKIYQIINWLDNLPSAEPQIIACGEGELTDINVGDMISRQQAVDICENAIDLWNGQLGCGALVAVKNKIAELPSADLSARVSKALSKEETERFRKAMKNARLGLYPNAEPHSINLNQGQSSDMISRQAAIDALGEEPYGDSNYDLGCRNQWKYDVEAIQNLPFAEPQIVRCKDCKHYKFADNRAFGFPVKRCEWTGFEDVDDDDFCSRAERMEVDNE